MFTPVLHDICSSRRLKQTFHVPPDENQNHVTSTLDSVIMLMFLPGKFIIKKLPLTQTESSFHFQPVYSSG